MPEDHIMSEAAAKEILALLYRQAEDCNDLLRDLQPQVSPGELRQCALVIGHVLAAFYDEGLSPIFRLHPHLTPDALK